MPTCYVLVFVASLGWVYQPTPCPTLLPAKPQPAQHVHHSSCGCHQQHRQKRKPDWSWRKRWTFRVNL
jgi:hypothetical protein